jgi:23S rRNA G2445 N2-methylase RlmL
LWRGVFGIGGQMVARVSIEGCSEAGQVRFFLSKEIRIRIFMQLGEVKITSKERLVKSFKKLEKYIWVLFLAPKNMFLIKDFKKFKMSKIFHFQFKNLYA